MRGRRRIIKQWTRWSIAAKDYVCSECEETITFGMEFTRTVMVNKHDKFEIEFRHESPDCEILRTLK